MIEQGCVVYFDNKKCLLVSKCHGKIIVKGIRNPKNGLYQLDFRNLKVHENVVTSSMELAHLWRHRLGHLNYQNLHNLIANHLAIRIPYIPMHHEVYNSSNLENKSEQDS
jgi:hypothetical protein